MNSKRRALLNDAITFLEKASAIISQASDQEQDCLDNVPENLQDSDKCSDMQEAIDNLEDATSSIDEAIGNIKDVVS